MSRKDQRPRLSGKWLMISALIDAIELQRSIVESYAHMPGDKARTDALAQKRRYEALLFKRYGVRISNPKMERVRLADVAVGPGKFEVGSPISTCADCEGQGWNWSMPDGHKVECGACEGSGRV